MAPTETLAEQVAESVAEKMPTHGEAEEVLRHLDDMQACDTVSGILVGICIVLALAVCFFGYRIYKFAFVAFAFLVGFGIEAAVGSAWLANNPDPNGTAEKVIILVCSILWGTLFLVLAKRYHDTIEHILGFVFGICLGFVLTIAVLYILQTPIDNALGEKYQQYQGWENFAGITLGVPIALLTGYLCRNSVMILVMVVTALVGAAAAWRWGRSLIACTVSEEEREDTVLASNYFNLAIFIGLALFGLGIQLFFRPRGTPVFKSAESEAPSTVTAVTEEEAAPA